MVLATRLTDLLGTQLVRYALVGLAINAVGYFLYLVLTAVLLPPKAAMTVLYVLGVLSGYFGNSRYSFRYEGSKFGASLRYVAAHLVGYTTNVLLLYVFYESYGFPHQLVQLVAIFIVALEVFVILKLFVFPAVVKTRPRS